MRLMEVVWDDHQFHFGEYGGDGITRFTSVGYFVAETPTTLALAQSIKSTGKFNEVIVIDKRMLVKRRFIKEG